MNPDLVFDFVLSRLEYISKRVRKKLAPRKLATKNAQKALSDLKPISTRLLNNFKTDILKNNDIHMEAIDFQNQILSLFEDLRGDMLLLENSERTPELKKNILKFDDDFRRVIEVYEDEKYLVKEAALTSQIENADIVLSRYVNKIESISNTLAAKTTKMKVDNLKIEAWCNDLEIIKQQKIPRILDKKRAERSQE